MNEEQLQKILSYWPAYVPGTVESGDRGVGRQDVYALVAEVRKLLADITDLRRQVRDLEELLRREEARN